MITSRMLIYFQILFLLIFSTIFYLLLDDYDKAAANNLAEYTVYQDKAIRKYNRNVQKKSIALLKEQGVLKEDFFNIGLMSSSYMSREIHNQYRKLVKDNHIDDAVEVVYKSVSNNPLNPLNKANSFELSLIEEMQAKGKGSISKVINIDDKKMMVNGTLERNRLACLQCHGQPKDAPKELRDTYGTGSGFYEKVGDVRGISLVYTSLDTHEVTKNTFFITVVGSVVLLLVIVYFIMQHYGKELKRKDKLLIKQSQYAALGEMGMTIITQWREPLSKISMRLDNMIMDHEFGGVDAEDHLKRLREAEEYLNVFANSVEKFKTLYDPFQVATLVQPTIIFDDVLTVLNKESILSNVTFNKEFKTKASIEMKGNVFFIASLELIKVFLQLSKVSTSAPTIINIIIYEEEGLKVNVLANIEISDASKHDLNKGHNSALVMTKLLVEEQLNGKFSFICSGNLLDISITLPTKVDMELHHGL